MTKEERAEQSRLRAIEHQRRKRTRILLFMAGVVLYVIVPLVWNGAIEFGWVQPIRTPEFRSSVQLAGLVAIALMVFNLDTIIGVYSKKKTGGKEGQVPVQPQTSA